jgi:transmembrane sensor
MMTDYTSFQTDDFVTDDYFISWVLQPTPETNAYWEGYLAAHPRQRKSIEQARLLVQAMRVNWHPVSEEQSRESYQRLEEKLFRSKSIPLWSNRIYQVAAAVALLLVAFSAWFILNQFTGKTTYQTAYGELRTITLPDQSVVTLNANSKLTLSRRWHSAADREVWLDGEAFFQVTRLENRQRFLVHTSDKLTVEVLGTAFNVFKRPSGTRVLLQSGKVQLNLGKQNTPEAVVMQPGELIELQPGSDSYSRKMVDPGTAAAWTERRLIFDNTPLSEIITILEETYGLQVKVSRPELLQKRVFGSCPTDDIDVFLTAISKPFGLTARRNGKNVWISSS